MSVLAKMDSEVSSLTQLSPSRSPGRGGRPIYYVQSPSRDSHDGEKTTNSFHSSPVLSPMGSPPHSHSNSSLGPHSRDSSSTRISGSRKQNNNGNGSNRKGSSWGPWKDRFDAIEEEGLLDDDGVSSGNGRRGYFLAFVVGFLVLFSVFSLILWGASKPQKPLITMKAKSLPTVVGPFGGTSSEPWDDGFMHDGVQEINISYDTNGIGTFNAVYNVNGCAYPGPRHYAGIGGQYTNETIELNYPNEYITSVEVYYGPLSGARNDVVRSLSFKINTGKIYGPYGVQQGTSVTASGPKIVGFFGNTGFDYLEAIGLYSRT